MWDSMTRYAGGGHPTVPDVVPCISSALNLAHSIHYQIRGPRSFVLSRCLAGAASAVSEITAHDGRRALPRASPQAPYPLRPKLRDLWMHRTQGRLPGDASSWPLWCTADMISHTTRRFEGGEGPVPCYEPALLQSAFS